MVQDESISYMTVSAMIAIFLPLILFFIWRKKYSLKVLPMFTGVMIYLVFVIAFQPIIHYIILSPRADGSQIIFATDPAMYVLYGILVVGFLEETGRFAAFQLLKKKYKGNGTAISYGIGHGGIEAILLVGFTLVSSIALSSLINSDDLNIASLAAEDPAVFALINELIANEPINFLAPGLERILTISAHISLSVIVYCSVQVKGKLWLYPAAIVMHAIFNIAPIMFQVGLITNIWHVELTLLILAAIIATAAFFVCKIIKQNETEEEPEEEQEEEPRKKPEEETEEESRKKPEDETEKPVESEIKHEKTNN